MSDDQTQPPYRSAGSDGAREPGRAGGIGRAFGLGWLRRTLFGGRTRSTATVGVLGCLVATALALAFLLPDTGPGRAIRGATHVPGAVVPGIGSGTTNEDITKAYPRLYSNRLGVDVAIRPGDGGQHPPVVPIAFQLPNTAPLGKPGNTYLYAHDRPGMFLGLHSAHIGDVLIVAQTATEKLYYQITEIHASVAWNDVKWEQPTSDARVTLQTCNFSGDFDPRFVVVTRQIPRELGLSLTSNA